MIGQYLSNTNESATVSISQKILELNKAYGPWMMDPPDAIYSFCPWDKALKCKTLSHSLRQLTTYYLCYFADVAAYLLKKEVEKIRLKVLFRLQIHIVRGNK